jgi:hypothetical protein
MKEVTLKIGKRQEIIDYFKDKIKGKVDVPFCSKEAVDIRTIEIKTSAHLDGTVYGIGKDYYEQFIIQDYADLRLNKEMERLDNMELRKRRLDAIKAVINMELDAEERWNRILKIVDEFDGVSIPFRPNTII